MSLTEKKIREAKSGSRNRIEWDGNVKGLGLRITKAGAKSYVLSYRADGRKRLMTLGRTSEMGLAKARELAGAALVRVRGGADPLEEKAQHKVLPSVAEGVIKTAATDSTHDSGSSSKKSSPGSISCPDRRSEVTTTPALNLSCRSVASVAFTRDSYRVSAEASRPSPGSLAVR